MLSMRQVVQGAYYAMEQSGRLLVDAVQLYEARRWSSSLVLAVFSLEELGKADMLLARAVEAGENGQRTVAQVMAGVARHTTKLRAGRGPLTVTASVGFWGDVPEPNTQEMVELQRRLAEADRIALEHAPGAAHEARMRALYVDFGDFNMWTRPVETTSDDAYLLVSAASIEYDVRRRKFVDPTNAAVARAVEELGALLPPLPNAPHVEWPD
jgi:AbiV family abortive infection protein